jgi:tyrosyl-tRNA synthetase
VSALLFEKGDPAALSPAALEALGAEIPCAMYAPPEGSPAAEVEVVECLVQLGLAASRGAAKRLVEQGGVQVNGSKALAAERTVPRERALQGRYLLVKKGGRDFGLVVLPPA